MMLETKFRLGTSNRGFRVEIMAQYEFARKSRFRDFGVDACRFVEVFGAAFLVFWSLKTRLENRGIFVIQTDPETLSWRGGSTGYLGIKT